MELKTSSQEPSQQQKETYQLKFHQHKVFEDLDLKSKPFKPWECNGNQYVQGGCKSSQIGNKINSQETKKYICDKKCASIQICASCLIQTQDAAMLPDQIDHPLHPKHPVQRNYNLQEEWICNATDYLGCLSKINPQKGIKGIDRFSCKQCNFDLCLKCLFYYIENPNSVTLYQVNSSLHSHPVTRWFDDNGWCCDGSKKNANGCASNITGFGQTTNMNRWRCKDCDFDLCEKCLQGTMTDACPFSPPVTRDTFQQTQI